METIRVNMTPCEDVQTIHASQNDNEGREWGFELHNNGEKIDSSSISDQLVFKAYKGGTEEILPENGSTPTTSPFKGDIRYPQGLLTDQEFLYRQSPTEEDGLAFIESIKGNTIVWNQLIQNGNFADTSNWSSTRGTISASNNVLTYEVTSVGDSNSANRIIQGINILANHKYLFIGDIMGSKDGIRIIASRNVSSQYFVGSTVLSTANTWYKVSGIGEPTGDGENLCIRYTNVPTIGEVGDKIYMRNIMLIDLTKMGLDSITDPSEFTSLFPLPYYDYNQGSLLSFMGNGIKTVGKNFVNVDFELLKVRNSLGTWNGTEYTYQGVTFKVNFTSQGYIDSVVVNGTATANANLNLMRLLRPSTFFNKPITMSGCPSGGSSSKYRMTLQMQTSPYTTIGHDYGNGLNATIPDNGEDYQVIIRIISGYTCNNVVFRPMITFQGEDQTYEPYTSSTLSLPISTYFPSGMKSAVSVYDELTESKAITRIGMVDLGTITYTYDGECFIGQLPSDAKVLSANTETLNSVSDRYLINNWSSVKYLKSNMTLGTGVNRYICIFNNSYTDPSAFKTAMNGVYLYYEMVNETETSFSTASLVTENAEIPLSNEDGVLIGKCTEQLSSESGFFDAKIKLADDDGECYSNKIQLHVERKPS